MEAGIAHYLTLGHVARLTGAPRSRLQEMARAGELATFDGSVEIAEVLRAFPDIRLTDDTEILRVEAIKAAAAGKSPEAALPDAMVLLGRLEALGREYAAAKVTADHLGNVCSWLLERLRDMAQAGEIAPTAADAIAAFLRREAEMPAGERARREALIGRESRFRIMSAEATLLPKGRHFEVEGRETLLEAGLRAGHSLPYGCSNGACGECKARVVSGEAVKVRPHDYMLTQTEKAQGYVLACAYSPVGDIALEISEPGVADMPLQDIGAKVRAIEPLGPGIAALHVVTPPSRRLRFLAGQKLLVTANGVSAELPVASCPCEERRIELHVRDTDGDFWRLAASGLKAGHDVRLKGPFGRFVLDEASRRPLLLFAQGAGFAQIKSLLQHALALEQAPTIAMVRLTDAAGAYQENLLRSYAASLDAFRCHCVADAEGLAAAFAAVADGQTPVAGYDAYLAGDVGAVASAKRILADKGVPAERMFSDIAG